MVDFCVEPKDPCCKNPIGELDFKIDKCYSSIYSRLCRHVNDSVSHISQEERDEWNGKASNSALLDLQDQLNEIAGDGDNSIKKEILIEVSRQISGAIDDLNLGDYAKKKYVDDAISNIDFDQYITKKNADSTYLNKADYIKFDPTNYYTIAQIQKIFGYSKSYFKKHTSNSVAPSKPSANRPPEDGSGWVDDAPNQEAGYYIWMTQVFINGNGQYGEYTNPICLTGTAGENAVSYDIKTSTSTINYQDGAMYPKTISVYVAKSNGSQITNITPSNGSDWQFSYSTNDGTTWNEILFDQIQTGGNYGMLFKATNGTVILNEYVPIVRSGIDGLNGVTYSLQLSNISLSYIPVDQNYSLQMSFNVNLYKNENTVNDASVKLYMQLNQNTRTSLQYDSGHWTASINTTVQSKSSTITIYAYNSNGAYLTSMNIPVSASGQKGDNGESVGQTFKGSPLRILGEWQSGKKYYDGKRDAQDGIFYQDVVIYEHTYYVCIDTNAGNDNGWNLTPDVAGYWQNFTVTEDLVTQRIIANQGIIKELSSEEVVIMDNGAIVAGMTSSKQPNSKSDLNGKVEHKGDVRIWAGEISNSDLTTAPFTVTNKGVVTSGTDNKIILDNGTIWFVVGNEKWHLGITNGKPDWITSANLSNAYYYQASNSSNSVNLTSSKMIYDNDSDIYYTDYANKIRANGSYLKEIGNSIIDDCIICNVSMTQYFAAKAKLYISCYFNNGSKTERDEYFIIGTDWDVSEGVVRYHSGKYAYYRIYREDAPVPTVSEIYDVDGEVKWSGYQFESGSTKINYAEKTFNQTSYNNSATKPSIVGISDESNKKLKVYSFNA